MIKGLLFLAPFLLLLAGCATVPLPEEALSRVDPTVEFAQVKANPERYAGTTLLVGGQIVANAAGREGTVLEILRYELNSSGQPVRVDEAGGRFLVRSERFLDPEIYEKGDYITLTGTVLGQEEKPLQGIEYTYPVFRLDAAHLWRESPASYYPGYYNPYGPGYYYPYSYDPFWYPFDRPGYRDRFWGYRPWYW
ncbi:MAG: Slp/YeaY family lipoprotein [Desulfuromonadales bacterium]|jgi:outer membrane lipoprotein